VDFILLKKVVRRHRAQ